MPNEAVFIEPELETDYEIERDKPMPSLDHALVQARLLFLLMRDYSTDFSFPSELSLGFLPKGSTPDVCIYPKIKRDLKNDEPIIKMTVPPLTAIEIISPKQALEDIIGKARNIYFSNQVKSVWIIIPSFEAIMLVFPGMDTTYFNKGAFHDPATDIRLSIEEVFDV